MSDRVTFPEFLQVLDDKLRVPFMVNTVDDNTKTELLKIINSRQHPIDFFADCFRWQGAPEGLAFWTGEHERFKKKYGE